MKLTIDIPSELINTKTNIKKIISLILLTILSIGIIIYAQYSGFDTSSTSFILICTIGYIGLGRAIFGFFSSNRYAVYAPTQSKLTCKTIEFNLSDYDKVKEIVENGDIYNIPSFSEKDGVAMRLEIIYSADKKFVAYQYFKYEPYEFLPISMVKYIS